MAVPLVVRELGHFDAGTGILNDSHFRGHFKSRSTECWPPGN